MTSTSSTIIDLQAISSLLAGLEIDNNVFNELQLQGQPVGRQVVSRPQLQPSLSLPLESCYPADHSGASVGDAAFLSPRLPAPKLVERRTQSIGESTQRVGQDVAGMMPKQVATATPTRYKTELCRPYEENGTCRYGNKCQFAHGKAELRSVVRHPKYKTDLCRTFHTTGLCPYGPRCHFIHNDDERRTSESSTDQLLQLAAAQEIGRRSTSIQHSLEDRPRLQRQYSEYRPRSDAGQNGVPVSGDPRGGPGTDLRRRATSVADAVIRRSLGYQHKLQTVVESDQQRPPGLNVNTAIRSLGSAADSFSSASSVTDSPSPSPTAALVPPAVEDCVAPTPPVRQAPAASTALSPDSEPAKAALLAEIVSRLGPQDLAAALVRAIQLGLPGNATATSPGGLPPREYDGREVERQWQPDILTQYIQQQQQQQQRASVTSNVCW